MWHPSLPCTHTYPCSSPPFFCLLLLLFNRNLLPSLEMLPLLFLPAPFWGPKPGFTHQTQLPFFSQHQNNKPADEMQFKKKIPVWPTSLAVSLLCLLLVPAAVCLCLSRMRWFQEHADAGGASNGLEIKLHQNKQQPRSCQATGPCPRLDSIPCGKWTMEGLDLLRALWPFQAP